VVGDRVFVGTTDGKILALNLQTGEKNWEFVTGSGFVASPSVANGCLVIGTTDGTLYCFGKAAE
jgi:outer membrane protein assembly factor BamB